MASRFEFGRGRGIESTLNNRFFNFVAIRFGEGEINPQELAKELQNLGSQCRYVVVEEDGKKTMFVTSLTARDKVLHLDSFIRSGAAVDRGVVYPQSSPKPVIPANPEELFSGLTTKEGRMATATGVGDLFDVTIFEE